MTLKQKAAIANYVRLHGQQKAATRIGITINTLRSFLGCSTQQATIQRLERFANKLLTKEVK